MKQASTYSLDTITHVILDLLKTKFQASFFEDDRFFAVTEGWSLMSVRFISKKKNLRLYLHRKEGERFLHDKRACLYHL